MATKKQNDYFIKDGIVHMELRRRNAENLWTIFDEDDLQKVLAFPYSWCADFNKNNGQFYVTSSIHKQCWREFYGRCLFRLHNYLLTENPKDAIVVDHINHDSLDNRRSNLRAVTYSQNSQNRKGCNANNVTGHRNVALIDGKYLVQLFVNGERLKFGPFDDLQVASIVAEQAREKHYYCQ